MGPHAPLRPPRQGSSEALARRSQSRDFIPERELAADALRLDLWVAPDPEKLSTLTPFGLLRRIAEQGPCAFEFFHQAPSLDEVLGSLQKALFLRRPAKLPARLDEPWLWIIAGGRPSQAISAFALRPEPGWPAGVYVGEPALRLRLIVTGELPRVPDTLLLRALGAGKTLRQAQRELRDNGMDHPVSRIVIPLMLSLHLELRDNPPNPDDPEAQEFVMETQDLYEAWRQKVEASGELRGELRGRAEGEARGRAEALLAVLEARGLAISAEQVAVVQACRDLEKLEAWLRRAASAASAEDVLR